MMVLVIGSGRKRQVIIGQLQNSDFSIPIGKTMNLHCTMFDKSILIIIINLYRYFASSSTESVFIIFAYP